jgi:DNA-binding SARP family transcriptional activator
VDHLATFVHDIVSSTLDHAQVFALQGALDGTTSPHELTNLTVLSDPKTILTSLGPKTTSLLILAQSTQELLVREIETILTTSGRSTLSLAKTDPTDNKSDKSVTLRVVFVDPASNADALVVFDYTGARQLFVRPEFNRVETTLDSPGEASAHHQPEVLFDRVTPTRNVGIAILGPVAMTGTNYPLERHPKLTELVVYLTLHSEGATSRNWTTALWPERRVPAQTVANRLSEARRIVGFASDGRPRLRRNGERHCLVEFNSDWSDFQRLADSDSPEHWRRALELVRGRPFDELAQGQWVVFEGFLAEIERSVASVALMLGDVALEAGDAELCAWAAQQALKACPFDERLHRMLMRAADALGNRAGVESTLRQLALILEIDGNPLHGVHPKTAKLYHELTATSVSRA